MKGMLKILGRYVGSAAAITLILLTLNILLFLLWTVRIQPERGNAYWTSVIADGLQKQEDGYALSETALQAVNDRYEWAMLLSDQGVIRWSLNLPEELSRSYTLPETASFTRWYLEDYPVYVWRHTDGLLVMGRPKGSIWKMSVEMPQSVMDKTLLWIPVVLAANGLAAVLLALLLGLRLFRSLRLLGEGIERMAEKKPSKLPANGVLSDLAALLNQTSLRLQRQEEALQKRDYARTSWIAGVSHDIRTPLSMVMGYASQLEENPELPLRAREQAGIVRRQSERIRALVNDLNLASKLEYDMQPVRRDMVSLAAMVRSISADLLNGGLSEKYTIDLIAGDSAQDIRVPGDEELLRRAVYNLIENSVRHNPEGCDIRITLSKELSNCMVSVSDNGAGFSKELLEQMEDWDAPTDMPNHGLGLRLVRQIARVHGGTAELKNLPAGGCEVSLCLPC